MKKIYKRLFNFDYNNKTFCIFLDEYYRCAFLELKSNGNYAYPWLEDFLNLNEMFNNSNPLVANITKCKFDEKVKKGIIGGTLYFTVLISLAFGTTRLAPRLTNNNEIVLENQIDTDKEIIEITDTFELDEILGYKVASLEDIHETIDNNANISLDYKRKTHLFLNVLTNKYSDLDLRIFYENIKDIEMIYVDDDYFVKLGEPGVEAKYLAESNQLLVKKNISDELFYHELSHVFDLYYQENEDKVIVKGFKLGRTLSEAMTNDAVHTIAPINSYSKGCILLDYLKNYVNYDYNDFNHHGIEYLNTLLKEKYPKVDIDYIFSSLDVANSAELSSGNFVYFDGIEGFLDEIFKICKMELENSTDNYYEPFNEFAKLLYYSSDYVNNDYQLMNNYLDKYNALLRKKGIPIITMEDVTRTMSKYKNAKNFIYKENEVLAYSNSELKASSNGHMTYFFDAYDAFGNTKTVDGNSYSKAFNLEGGLSCYLTLSSLGHYDNIGTFDYWKQVAIDSGYISPADVEEIPIYINGNLLGKDYLGDLSIAISLLPSGENGYIIKKDNGNIIYCSDYSTSQNQNLQFIPLNKYLKNYKPTEFNVLELANVLNDYYLIDLLKDEELFNNIMIVDDEARYLSNYQIIVNGDDKFSQFFDLGTCFFELDEKTGDIAFYPLDYTPGFNNPVYLKYILDYYGILDEDILEYNFSYDELVDLYYKYINDVSLENDTVGLKQ